MARKITKNRLLLGEGRDEVHFFNAFLRNVGLHDAVQVLDTEGKDNIPPYLQTLPDDDFFYGCDEFFLAITRDADTVEEGTDGVFRQVAGSVEQAFESVAGALTTAGLPTPANPGKIETGEGSKCKVGVFIFPDNRGTGMLEDLCLQAIDEQPEMVCLEEYLECAREKANLAPGIESKGRVQAWLALQPHSDRRLGIGAEKGYWPFDHPVFDQLKRFLLDLFATSGTS